MGRIKLPVAETELAIGRLGHRIAYEVEQAKIRCSQGEPDTRIDLSELEPSLAVPMAILVGQPPTALEKLAMSSSRPPICWP